MALPFKFHLLLFMPKIELLETVQHTAKNYKKGKYKKQKPRKQKAKQLVVVAAKRPQPKKRKQKTRKPRFLDLSDRVASQWIKSLRDPFDIAPPDLTSGSYPAPNVYTQFARGAFSLTAGYGLLSLNPYSTTDSVYTSSVATSTTVFSAGTVVAVPWPGLATAGTQFTSHRLLSGGLRWRCSFAGTSSPGMCYAGEFYTATTTMIGWTPAVIQSHPSVTMTDTLKGGALTWRPDSMADLVLTTSGLLTDTTNSLYNIPAACFYGLPSGTVIYYEAIFNYEGVATSTTVDIFPHRLKPQTKGYIDMEKVYSIGMSNSGPAYSLPKPMGSSKIMGSVLGRRVDMRDHKAHVLMQKDEGYEEVEMDVKEQDTFLGSSMRAVSYALPIVAGLAYDRHLQRARDPRNV